MRHRLFVRSLRLGGALVLAVLLSCAQAVELGEPAVRSYIGQALIADIELSGFAGEGAPVQVKLAHPDVYRGASIRVHPVLASLNMSVMRRDGRQFLHLTTLKPVDTEYVHVFLELSEGGRRSVRGATLWLTADPQPAPPPAPVPAPLPAPLPVAARVEPAPVAAPLPALVRAASCPRPQFTAEQIKTCSTLDYKNAMLSAQIVELEEKVKLLQMDIEARPQAAALAGPPPIRTASAASGPKAAKAAGEAQTPWLLIAAVGAAALVALAGAAVFFAKRRAKGPARAAAAASTPGFMAKLRERLKRDKKAGAAAPQQEPHT